MEFVALLSGGKDSIYTIQQCLQYGHRLVCLANLSPFPSQTILPNSSNSSTTSSHVALTSDSVGNEELHSFMYQSAGASIMPAYANCLQVPLYIQQITGSAVQQGIDYTNDSQQHHDEVEDLYELLKQVTEAHPGIQAVSCGAIVSTYQRHRVENVCQRLGLTVLSYLWQRDRNVLLPEMLDAGIDAILVKVAGVGLVPEKHLGKTLKQLYSNLLQLHKKYGLDICGEGGEFESLVLNTSFFHQKIVIGDREVVLDAEDSQVGNLKINSYSLVPNDHYQPVAVLNKLNEELEDDLMALLEDVDIPEEEEEEEVAASSSGELLSLDNINLNSLHSVASSDLSQPFQLPHDQYGSTPLILPQPSYDGSNPSPEEIQAHMRDVMQQLKTFLSQQSVALEDVAFVHLYLANMEWFQVINEEYCKWFGKYPPSRSCIMLHVDVGKCCALSAFYLKDSYQSMLTKSSNQPLREVLHVKSMSTWAPLCIGPYAQCNSIYNHVLLHIAGQIPLDPSTMALRRHSCSHDIATTVQEAKKDIELDILLSLRHVARVLNVQQSSLSHAMHVTLYINMAHDLNRKIPRSAWKKYKRIIQTALNKEYKLQLSPELEQKEKFSSDDMFAEDFMNEEQEEWDEDNTEDADPWSRNAIIQMVGVPGLPRNSSVEVEVVAVRSQVLLPATRWQHLHEFVSESCLDLNMILQARSWPEKCHKMVKLPEYLATAVEDGTSCEIDAKSFPRCIGAGVIRVKATSASRPAQQIAKAIMRGMFALFGHEKFQMMVGNIRKCTVYYSEHAILSGEDLYSSLHDLFEDCGIASLFPLVILPAVCLEDEHTIATVQISGVDLHQIETEAWIERGKGFTS